MSFMYLRWGTLFYEADHYVYLLHKSLSDWLLDVHKSYRHAVDVTRGHLLFGLHLLKDVEKVNRGSWYFGLQ